MMLVVVDGLLRVRAANPCDAGGEGLGEKGEKKNVPKMKRKLAILFFK